MDKRPSQRVEVKAQATSAKRVNRTLAACLMQARAEHALLAKDRPRW